MAPIDTHDGSPRIDAMRSNPSTLAQRTYVAIGTGSSPFAFTGSGLGGGAAFTGAGSCARGAELSTFFLLRGLLEPLRSVGRADA